MKKQLLIAVGLLFAPFAIAETVTFDLFNYENLEVPTGKTAEFMEGYEKYFLDDCEVKNMYFRDGYLGFGVQSSAVDHGVLTLRLSSWFQNAEIESVSLEAYAASSVSGTVFLWVNDVRSESTVPKDQGSCLCNLNGQRCEELSFSIYRSATNTTQISAYNAVSLTIVYNPPAHVEPEEVNAEAGISGYAIGTLVKFSGCALNESEACVIKDCDTDVGGTQPHVYSIPVAWPDGAEKAAGVCADIIGTIQDRGGKKVIEVTQWEEIQSPSEPVPAPLPIVNGEAQTGDPSAIPADCRFEFYHPYGDNVEIYYTKRYDAELDIASATTDPALIEGRSSSRRASADNVDETGTYRYTGAFRPVHAANIPTTDQSNVAIKYVAVPTSTLAAAPLWGQSEQNTFGKGMISTGCADVIANTGPEYVRHVDLQGRPCSELRPNSTVIEITAEGARLIFYQEN